MIRVQDKGKPRRPNVCDCGDHAFIVTTKWATALFDCADCERVGEGQWHLNSRGYAACKSGQQEIAMQNLFFPQRVGHVIDHINGDRLDNRRSNLRWATFAQNIQNSWPRKQANKTSRFKGVSRTKTGWEVTCASMGKRKRATVYGTEEEAARLYDQFAIELFGVFARTNEAMGMFDATNRMSTNHHGAA